MILSSCQCFQVLSSLVLGAGNQARFSGVGKGIIEKNSENLAFGCTLFSNVESDYRRVSKDKNGFICNLLLYKLQMLLYCLPMDKEYVAHKMASSITYPSTYINTVKEGGGG